MFFLNSVSERSGFYKWAQKVKAWSYGIWVLPKGGNGHWTMIIIVFLTKQIICIDSLHGQLPKSTLETICSFIETIFSKANIPYFDWSEWTIFYPHDIPTQVTKEHGVGVNCGIHVCCGVIFYAAVNVYTSQSTSQT